MIVNQEALQCSEPTDSTALSLFLLALMVSIWNFNKNINLRLYGVSQNYALSPTLTFERLRFVERDFEM